MFQTVQDFWERLEKLPRPEILKIIRDQDPEYIPQIKRIEDVFKNKLQHLHHKDGSPITGRPLTNQELARLVDPPFMFSKELKEMGIPLDEQRQLHIASDPIIWAKKFLKVQPRVYQVLLLRDPSKRRVWRLGRRMGKTFSLAILLLHYAYTNQGGRCLVMAPMKSQVEVIYQEVIRLSNQGPVASSITRSVTSPQFEIRFTNDSTIRFFTTGMKTGAKSDVARGQEAHIIVLDEMDYMGQDDLDALYAMLQKTDEAQAEKIMVGASTPTGRRERFYEWATQSKYFHEYWFPAYANPLWNDQMEEEMRDQYSSYAYRHEIEADWGEDAEGVYPRRFVDRAFVTPSWIYRAEREIDRNLYVMGVDWDKYAAGPNIVVLEVCLSDYTDPRFAGKLKLAYREEIERSEYILLSAVDRVVDLNNRFHPTWIYVDRGFGETQVEMLHKYGVDHPDTGLNKKVRGINFSELLEMRDPATRQVVKKEIKPFMIDNLRGFLERDEIVFPADDQELYMQLISYIVLRTTSTGRPVFEASGTQVDHAHDALILACLAYTQNYGELHRLNFATKSKAISNEVFLPTFSLSDNPAERQAEMEIVEETWGSPTEAPLTIKRKGAMIRRGSSYRPITRKMFKL